MAFLIVVCAALRPAPAARDLPCSGRHCRFPWCLFVDNLKATGTLQCLGGCLLFLGPRFAMTNSTLRATADGDADPDAGMLRALLASARLMPAKEVDTATETAAIKKLQQATHLRVTGKDNDLEDALHGIIQLNNGIAAGWSITSQKSLMKRPRSCRS